METNEKLRCTEETDFVVLSYDPSDIEEIEENEENLKHCEADSSIDVQYDDDNTLRTSDHIDGSQSDEDAINEEGTDQVEVRRRRVHGSEPEGLADEPELEAVGTTMDLVEHESCSRLSNHDEGESEEDESENDTDQENLDVAYFMQNENGVEMEEEIMDLRTIKRPRTDGHAPNPNPRFEVLLCFTLTAGFFMSLGNYLSYNSNSSDVKALMARNNDNIARIKELQDKLSNCIDAQTKRDSDPIKLKELIQHDKHWRERLDSMSRGAELGPVWYDKKKDKKIKLESEGRKKKKKEKERKKERKGEKSKFDRESERGRTKEGLKGEKT